VARSSGNGRSARRAIGATARAGRANLRPIGANGLRSGVGVDPLSEGVVGHKQLPSLVTKYATPEGRGAAIGINSSAQFLGAFAGAAFGGWLAEHVGNASVFAFCMVLVGAWLAVALTMSHPLRNVSNQSLGET